MTPPRAELIGPENAAAVTGQNWRWCRNFARAQGIAILQIGAKSAIDAGELVQAMRAAAATDDAGETEDMRRFVAGGE